MDILYCVHEEKSNVFLLFCVLYKNLIISISVLCISSFPWAERCKNGIKHRFPDIQSGRFPSSGGKMNNPVRFLKEPDGASHYYIVSYSFLALYSLYISSVARRTFATDTDLSFGKQK